MEKILIICGPTATGKTALALSLAKTFDGELISADSRQVYTGMDVGTGKDLPAGTKWEKDHYQIREVSLWGYDLTSPKQEYSVAQFVGYAEKTIKSIVQRGHLPILVGGTGLYIKAVIDGIETAAVPRNMKLRKNLMGRSTDELYEHLAQIDAIRAAALNASDRQNPRRLVRAIEVSQWELESGKLKKEKKPDYDTLFIGLTAPRDVLETRIEMRIEARMKNKVIKEIERLLKEGIGWEYQSMSSLGYRQLREYYEGRSSLDGALALWAREEKKYVKRQLTWWKQDKRINWQDISLPGWAEKVAKKVKIWYSLANAEKN